MLGRQNCGEIRLQPTRTFWRASLGIDMSRADVGRGGVVNEGKGSRPLDRLTGTCSVWLR